MALNQRSLDRLKGVHPHLVAIVNRAAQISPVRFQVSEGLRTAERQRELVKAGKSQTQNSRHLTGHAVDLVVLNEDGSANWDLKNYAALAADMARAALYVGAPLEWGGNWKTLRDGPHFQLPFGKYP